ncbi:MAG TPA: ATP synthase F1 subunit delta [Chitinophagales bacterium]|nr:ATP synthase F1 subunit delta [Chitinophagales bacterium]HMU69544.1 ATP synthase F1 subunit delta [Chitinophagales bacterium]HMX04535.1 ATP synthase F1 subunit delta [Chitinophagales bacterium]HMZ90091.1 ATP synthase F1 subunit delta [Chitinophagales bacterium]HNA57801.1 ATP synthase F1 subunit delta [Chitinophagales bacterium]
MSATKLAARYAKSVLDLAKEQGKLELVLSDMRLIQSAIDSNREFYLMLKSPIVHGDKKMEVVLGVFHNKVNEITESFIGILMRKNRESYLPEIIQAFIEQYNTLHHITPVTVITAQPISEELHNTIINRLKTEAGLMKVELTQEVDPALIGGYVLRWDNKLIDNSIARGLTLLKDEFDNNDYIRKF